MTAQWWAEFLTTFILIRIGIIAWRRCKERRIKWIPRTEREPDTGGHILITVLWEKGVDTFFDNDYEVMEEDWAVGEYEIKEGTAAPLVKRIHERMIAWMPMPKPYRAERKEE